MSFGADREPTPPGEWETDSSGKRFRYDGRCIEYEQKIITSNGTLTQWQIADMSAREKQKPAFTYVEAPPPKRCPFKSGANTACSKEDCAWYTPEGCAMKCPHPAAGRKCPYKHTACTYDCALRDE